MAKPQGRRLAAVVCAATGQEIPIEPDEDAEFIACTLNPAWLVISAGRIATVIGALVINTDSSVLIAGTLMSDRRSAASAAIPLAAA